ncbi:hypothetical protein SEA_ZENTENO07_79 [Mycobacterium phage Zenteno07]|nr:hypothetical protein SEA_ZENTENO07_79 [Mycobacterium phage Zenteno07]
MAERLVAIPARLLAWMTGGDPLQRPAARAAMSTPPSATPTSSVDPEAMTPDISLTQDFPEEVLASNRYTDLMKDAVVTKPKVGQMVQPVTISTDGPTSRTTSDEVPDDGTFESDLAWADEVDRATIRHNVELVERHSLSVRAGDLPDNGAGAIDVLRLHAQAYARDRGMELTNVMARVSTPVPDPREQRIAVEFDVVVGKGELALDRPEDDRWAWSYGAVTHVKNLLDGVLGSAPRTRLRVRETDDGGKVIEGRFGDPRRMPGGWQGGPAIRGEGITGKVGEPPFGPSTTVSLPELPADQRPPWLRRGDGWDEEDAPGWGDHPPLG